MHSPSLKKKDENAQPINRKGRNTMEKRSAKDQGRKNEREKIVDLAPTLTKSIRSVLTLQDGCARTRRRKAQGTLPIPRVEVMMIIIFGD